MIRGYPADPRVTALAVCADPSVDSEMFFSEGGVRSKEAKRVCQSCPVREACLAEALSVGQALAGIWGGTSPRDRAKIMGWSHSGLKSVRAG